MKFTFSAKIYKVGINPCVKVPRRITSQMDPKRGYIPVRGEIGGHRFEQTLVAVKNEPYRLYVNGLMLKGAGAAVGDTVQFTITQTTAKRRDEVMPTDLKQRLVKMDLLTAFEKLIPSRKKDILRYLNYLKTAEAKSRNIDKIVNLLLDS